MVEEVMPKEIRPGDVIKWNDKFAIVISNTYPADTVPARSLGYEGPNPAEDYCEPGVVVLAHQRDDRYVWTHEFTFMLLKINKSVRLFNGIRVQQHYKRGPFQTYAERLLA